MPWFKVDDKLHMHPKRYAAGLRAMGLWVVAGSWSGGQGTGGFVPHGMLAPLGGRPADAKALVSAGLWVPVEGGYQFHDWAERNPTSAEIEMKRQAERDRKAEWRARKAERKAATK